MKQSYRNATICILAILLSLALASCEEKQVDQEKVKEVKDATKTDFFWLRTRGANVDTINFQLFKNVKRDTMFLDYIGSYNDTMHFKFDLKDKYSAWAERVVPMIRASGDLGKQFVKTKCILQYQNDTTIKVFGRSYPIYKYLYDIENSWDEEAFYYWSPAFGILLVESDAGQIKRQLYAKDQKLDDTIGRLRRAIEKW